MKFTPENAQQIEDKKVANVLRKIFEEKQTPTAREEAILQRAVFQASGNDVPPSPGGYAHTWDELGCALGVSRRAIQEWKRDPRYAADCPRDRADGRKEVAAWIAFMVRHGLKRADQHVAPYATDDQEEAGDDQPGVIQPPRVRGSQAQWNVAIAALDHRKRENSIGIQEGTLLVAAELEVPLGAMLAAFQSKAAQFPARVAKFIKGLREESEIEERLRDEMDADLSDLQFASYTAQDAVAEAVAAVPFDTESARLLQLVTFDGQDREALLQLIALVAIQAVRQLGRRAIRPGEVLSPESHPTAEKTDAASPRETSVSNAASACGARAEGTTPIASAASTAPIAPKAGKKKSRSRRRKTTPPPAEIEAAIHVEPRKRKKR